MNKIDFVVQKGGAYKYFQVSASIMEEKPFNREMKVLKNNSYFRLIYNREL